MFSSHACKGFVFINNKILFFQDKTGILKVTEFTLNLKPKICLAFLINQSESCQPWQRVFLSVVPCLSLLWLCTTKTFPGLLCLLRTKQITSIFDFANQISEVLVPNRQWNEVARWKESSASFFWTSNPQCIPKESVPFTLSHCWCSFMCCN